MDPIDIIMKALLTGFSKFTENKTKDSLSKGFNFLFELIKKRFSKKLDKDKLSDANKLLASFQSDPNTWEKPIRKELQNVGADKDDDILKAAQTILSDCSINNTTQVINNNASINSQVIIQNQNNEYSDSKRK